MAKYQETVLKMQLKNDATGAYDWQEKPGFKFGDSGLAYWFNEKVNQFVPVSVLTGQSVNWLLPFYQVTKCKKYLEELAALPVDWTKLDNVTPENSIMQKLPDGRMLADVVQEIVRKYMD